MKFKENQDVFILYLKKIRKAKIFFADSLRGTYSIDLPPFIELKRGSEAIFNTEAEAQKYVETL